MTHPLVLFLDHKNFLQVRENVGCICSEGLKNFSKNVKHSICGDRKAAAFLTKLGEAEFHIVFCETGYSVKADEDDVLLPAYIGTGNAVIDDQFTVDLQTSGSRLLACVEKSRDVGLALHLRASVLLVAFVVDNFENSRVGEGLLPYLQTELDGQLLEFGEVGGRDRMTRRGDSRARGGLALVVGAVHGV